mgnify:CR=1 FL=1|jgi:hypothetical protein
MGVCRVCRSCRCSARDIRMAIGPICVHAVTDRDTARRPYRYTVHGARQVSSPKSRLRATARGCGTPVATCSRHVQHTAGQATPAPRSSSAGAAPPEDSDERRVDPWSALCALRESHRGAAQRPTFGLRASVSDCPSTFCVCIAGISTYCRFWSQRYSCSASAKFCTLHTCGG